MQEKREKERQPDKSAGEGYGKNKTAGTKGKGSTARLETMLEKGEADKTLDTKIEAPGISAEEEISLRTTAPVALTEDAKLKDHLLRHPERCFKLLQCSLKEAKTNELAGNKGAVEGNVAVPKSQLDGLLKLSGDGGVFVQQLRKYPPS